MKHFSLKIHIGNRMLRPETQMLNYGYDPHSTFSPSGLPRRRNGPLRFWSRVGASLPREWTQPGLYAVQSPQQRNCRGQRAENCALFSSGVAVIAMTILAFGKTSPRDSALSPPLLCTGSVACEDACGPAGAGPPDIHQCCPAGLVANSTYRSRHHFNELLVTYEQP